MQGTRYCECTASFTGPTCSTPKQSCGGLFRSPRGYVQFPIGTGNKYDHGLSCAWVLLTNHTMVLNVTFTKFALESSHGSDECRHDYVQVIIMLRLNKINVRKVQIYIGYKRILDP